MKRFQVLSKLQAKSLGMDVPERWVVWDRQHDEWTLAYRLKKDAQAQCKEWNLDEVAYKGYRIMEHHSRGYDICSGGVILGWEKTRVDAQVWIDKRESQYRRKQLTLVHSAPLTMYEVLRVRVKRARELEAKRKRDRRAA